ncbi:hypothetical protein ACFV16_09270 [Streptomyces massasporeus]|uniref:hypothetical protein n=1 Tax=Streptomyces massasporeus TaxID=67324 RepID=UPI0036A13D36
MSGKPDPRDELQLVRPAKSWAEAIVSDDPARIAGFMADEWVIVSAPGIDPREKFPTNTAHYKGERYDADEWTTDVFVRRQERRLCVLSHITPAAPD